MKPQWLDRFGAIQLPHFTLCINELEFRRELKRLKVTDDSDWCRSSATTWCLENKNGNNYAYIVCIKNFDDKHPCAVAALLVHEAVHIKQYFMRGIGEKTPSDEFEAYTTQWISQQLFYEFDRRMK